MIDYTIKLSVTDMVMKRAIDSAVHGAVERFKADLGENVELAADIAQAAAISAVDQFRTWANSELRLIQLEYERRANEMMLRPPSLYVPGEATKPA